jgi:hypothetical protein
LLLVTVHCAYSGYQLLKNDDAGLSVLRLPGLATLGTLGLPLAAARLLSGVEFPKREYRHRGPYRPPGEAFPGTYAMLLPLATWGGVVSLVAIAGIDLQSRPARILDALALLIRVIPAVGFLAAMLLIPGSRMLAARPSYESRQPRHSSPATQ